jgi:hypothetical protein
MYVYMCVLVLDREAAFHAPWCGSGRRRRRRRRGQEEAGKEEIKKEAKERVKRAVERGEPIDSILFESIETRKRKLLSRL